MVWMGACRPIVRSRAGQQLGRLRCRYSVTRCLKDSDASVPDLDTDIARKKQPKKYNPYKVTFSGIQPTGIPHLGNYLGAIRQWKQYQDDKLSSRHSEHHQLIFSVVDLHALTHSQSPAELQLRRYETFASLMAIGLDPKQSTIYFQSKISGHTQLFWYLSNVASTGYLSRMTQWKSKLGVSEQSSIEDKAARERLRLGLFSYPVLQAADILLFNTDLVPVGEDQEQHVEFTRSLARSFNAQYRDANGGQDFFKVPRIVLSPAKRIMSLKEPAVKMSKSHTDPNSRVLITDSPEDIHAKVKVALTDSIGGVSYDPQQRPGVSNLVEILKHVSGNTASCEEVAAENANHSMRAFKEHVADEIIKSLSGFRDRFSELMSPKNHELTDAINYGTKLAGARAGHTRQKLEELMGLGNRLKNTAAPATSSEEKKQKILQEQEEEEKQNQDEPDVTPQKDQGVDRPIAS